MTIRISRILTILPFVISFGASVRADEVSDALQAALDAYNSGNLAKTSESMTMAVQAVGARQSALLAALLPPAPDGWKMTLTDNFAQGFGIMGGGAGAEGRYENADQSVSYTISYIADNPMVATMGAMLGNAQMMAMMGKVVKVGEQPVLDAENVLSSLVNSRVLFQAQGADSAVMLPVIQAIDFAKVGTFDSK